MPIVQEVSNMFDVEQRRCNVCKNSYPATPEFFHRQGEQHGKVRLHSTCKTCRGQERALHIPVCQVMGTPNQCGSCGTTQGNILGDVDNSTKEKRGYLCAKCHRLVHDFQGDLKRMRKVLNYIERTQSARV